jgi:D-xylose transport system substrate-binding protein
MKSLDDVQRELRISAITRRDLIRRATLLGVSATSIVSLLAACGDDDGGGGEGGGGESLTLGFSLGTLAQARWQFDKQYVEEEAKRLGMEVVVQAAEDDERLQISQVENMVAQGIDALILSPINVETAAPAVTTAKEAGIPVVSYNSVVLDADVDYWVARDNVEVGRIQADLAVKAAPEGNYLIVSGEPGVDIAQEKTRGNMEVLQPLIDDGSINLVSQEYHRAWDPALGLKQIENGLSQTGNDVAAVLCNYDGFVLSALEALGEAGLVGKTWIGGEDVFPEVAQAIVEDQVAMSAYTDLQEMATTAVGAASDLAEDKEPSSNDSIDNGFAEIPGSRISSFAVTKENMCEFLKDTKWLEIDAVYKNGPPEC